VRKIRIRSLIASLAVLVVGISTYGILAVSSAQAADQQITGAWYVDTVGAPFTPHLFAFHADGILGITFPDAAEATNSAGMGIGVWRKLENVITGKFLENNADKATNKFTSNLVVTFTVTNLTQTTFRADAQASYFNAAGVRIDGPFPATLKGQRITFGSNAPIVTTT
jgi:hypothetical protein